MSAIVYSRNLSREDMESIIRERSENLIALCVVGFALMYFFGR